MRRRRRGRVLAAWCLIFAILMPAAGGGRNPQTVKAAETERVAETGSQNFVHPGMIHTAESFAAIRQNIEEEVQPNLNTWNMLLGDGFSDAGWNPRLLETVVRGGTGNNCARFYIDIRRAYQTALIWNINGSSQHGEAACRILNGWSGKLKAVTGNADRFLASGIYGYELANVAEIMRGHPSFDIGAMKELLLTVFYPMNDNFLNHHNDAHIGNYWANWDLCNIASMMSIGIFCDRRDIYEQALTYYKTGLGNGSLYNAMPYVYEDGTAQWQESGRDQGHTTFGIGLCEVICEMAWSQGDDLYGLSGNRFLKAAEYVAKYNGGQDVRYSPYEWLKGQNGTSQWQPEVSAAGRGSVRPVYSMVYNHYVNRKGLKAPALKALLDPERGEYIEGPQSNGDELGWQTLTFANLSRSAEDKPISGDFADGTYRIRSVMTGKSLVETAEGTLRSAEAGSKPEEWWILKNRGDGEYTVTNAVTGKVLQVENNYYSYGSVLGTGARTGGLNQNFAFVGNGDGNYRIVPSASYLVLALEGNGPADDTRIVQWRYNAGTGQRWVLERLPGQGEEPAVPPDTKPTASPDANPEPSVSPDINGPDPKEQAAKLRDARKKNWINTDVSLIHQEITGRKSDQDITGSRYSPLQAAAVTSTKRSLRLAWKKVAGADGYLIYGNRCGKKNICVKAGEVKGSRKNFLHTKLKKGTYYKYIVVAYKKVKGKRVTLAVSKTIHAVTAGGSCGNAGSVRVSKDRITLKRGAKYKIRSKVTVKAKKSRKHRAVGFESGNTKVAAVTAKGVVRAKKKGTSTIYVFAQNGVSKKIKVKVR